MRQAHTISALARRTGIRSKTLRYWERVGLLPKAARTHTGYRIFAADTDHYVEFILKAKSVGLTLSEMRQVLEMARQGENPCPAVVEWIDEKERAAERQIRSLRALQRRLRRFRGSYSVSTAATCARDDELCCLLEDLPNPHSAKGDAYEKALLARSSSSGRTRS